jgi:glycosyltransferase involved in cell wall biosynthesis
MAAALAADCTVIGNPYDDHVFRRDGRIARDRDLVFVGRLVREKGLDVVIEALAMLAPAGRRPLLTVIGAGPEEERLRRLVQERSLQNQVQFTGALAPREVARQLNRHRTLVLPSTCEKETFGIVALEAMACGCLPIVSRRGGLAEAVGAHGLIVEAGNVEAWARAISEGLRDDVREALMAGSVGHLWCRSPERVAKDYLDVLARAVVAGFGHVARA